MKKVVWAALPAAPFDHPLTEEQLDEIGRMAQDLYETTDYAIVLPLGCNLFEWSQFLFGMENLYLYLGSEKTRLCRVLAELVEIHLEFLSKLLPRIKGYVQVLVVGDDLGMQTGPQISRAMYRDIFFPRHKKIYSYAKEQSGAHIMLHSCGGIYQLMPDLIRSRRGDLQSRPDMRPCVMAHLANFL